MAGSRFRFIVFWLLSACVAVGNAGVVDTVFIPASRDVTLYEDSLGDLANGSGQHFFAGRTDLAGGGKIRRALVHFDIEGQVPADAYIAEAAMTLNMSQTSSDSQLVGVHRLLSMWTEGPSDPPGGEGSGAPPDTADATWLHCRFPSSFWSTPGGVFAAVPADTEWVRAVGQYTWNSMYMAAEVQVWLDTPAVNLGWAIVGNETEIKTTKRFDSREHPTPANRPVLMVVYSMSSSTTHTTGSDNTIYEDPSGGLSNGIGEFLVVGRVADSANSIRRALIRFGSLGSDLVILGVELRLHLVASSGVPEVVSLRRVLKNWSASGSDAAGDEEYGAPAASQDATWQHYRFPSQFWTEPGGDFSDTLSASLTVDTATGEYVWSGPGLVSDVQKWTNFGASRDGWMLFGNETSASTTMRFASLNHSDPALRPTLTVTWAPMCLIELAGDANVSGSITSGDIIHLVNYVLKSGLPPQPCLAAGDINCNGSVTTADIIALIMFVFKGGAAPCDICAGSPLASSCQLVN